MQRIDDFSPFSTPKTPDLSHFPAKSEPLPFRSLMQLIFWHTSSHKNQNQGKHEDNAFEENDSLKAQEKTIRELKRQLAELQEEKAILKKPIEYFSDK